MERIKRLCKTIFKSPSPFRERVGVRAGLMAVLMAAFLFLCLPVMAQSNVKVVVIADMESRKPLRDAVVHLNNNQSVKTNWTGKFIVYHDNFKSATISCPNYMQRVMTREEMMQRDTIFLLPTMNMLSEVVVYGKAPMITAFSMGDIHKEAVNAAPPKPTASFDFAKMLDRRKNRDRKHRDKLEKILENY